MTIKSENPTFSIRFVGDDISPRAISTRALAEALDAIQQILGGLQTPDEGDDVNLHLIGVRGGSAVYRLHASASPELVGGRLSSFGDSISSRSRDGMLDESVLSPLEILSRLVRTQQCSSLEIRGYGGGKNILARIGPATYSEFEQGSLVSGSTTVFGRLERLGGRHNQHCAIRVTQQSKKQLWCRVQSTDLVKQLGKYMFEVMQFRGDATWYRQSGHLKKLTIRDFEPPKRESFRRVWRDAREAGADAWDHVLDVQAEIRELRSE